MKFKECLKKARENAGLTQRELAEKLSVPASMIGRYESSDTEPRVDLVKRICKVLNITPNDLLSYDVSTREENIALIKSCGISITEGEFLEHSLRAAMTGNGKILKGYILTHLATGEKLEIEYNRFDTFIDEIIEKARQATSSHFKNEVLRLLNIEFFSSYAFVGEDEAFQIVNQELEEIKTSGEIEKIQQVQNKLSYLQAFYKKLRGNTQFQIEIGLLNPSEIEEE